MVMAVMVATAPSLARAGSLNSRMHKQASCVVAKKPATPTSTFVSHPAQSSRSSKLDVGMYQLPVLRWCRSSQCKIRIPSDRVDAWAYCS